MVVLLPARKVVYLGIHFMQSYKDMAQDTKNVGDLELKSDNVNKLRHVENYVENISHLEDPGLAMNFFHLCLLDFFFCQTGFLNSSCTSLVHK